MAGKRTKQHHRLASFLLKELKNRDIKLVVYNQERRTAFVPNEEIRQELITAVESKSWNEMLIFQQTSEEILNATLDMDTEEVAD